MENKAMSIIQYMTSIPLNAQPVVLEKTQKNYDIITYKHCKDPYAYVSFKRELAHELRKIKNSIQETQIEEKIEQSQRKG